MNIGLDITKADMEAIAYDMINRGKLKKYKTHFLVFIPHGYNNANGEWGWIILNDNNTIDEIVIADWANEAWRWKSK